MLKNEKRKAEIRSIKCSLENCIEDFIEYEEAYLRASDEDIQELLSKVLGLLVVTSKIETKQTN